MSNSLSEEQRMLRDSISRFLGDAYQFQKRRALLPSERAFDDKIWSGMAELGLMALILPQDFGGFDGGPSDVAVVMEEFGRNLVREPWLQTVVLPADLIARNGTAAQKKELLPELGAGELRIALALAEPQGRYSLTDVSTTAVRCDGGYLLQGEKALVIGAPHAERLLVSARTSGHPLDRDGISLFLVDSPATGLSRHDFLTLDGVSAANVTLASVRVGPHAMVGTLGAAADAIERIDQFAVAAMSADAVGAMRALLERTIEYAKVRSTFGKPLASQQVIQHRLVDMCLAIEHADAITGALVRALTRGGERRAILAAATKALIGRESRFVAQTGVQLHGAIGYSEELDVSHFFRRLTAFDALLGNRDYQLRSYFSARSSAPNQLSMFEFDSLTEDEIAFREQARKFLKQNLQPEMIKARQRTLWAFSDFETSREWQRILHEHGLGAPHWPIEYGGMNWSTNQHLIWSLECARADAPLVPNMGLDLCAPCVMAFGTDAQKDEFIPRIISGEDWWCQGYSEANAGSDLASLQLSATNDGDDYVLNGSKMWTTNAHNSNRIFCLVRTSTEQKKQQGITFLLIDMDSPGITVRPILNLAGEHDFNEVFFDDVRVPKSRRLGDEGEGWAVARHLLKFEHGGRVAVIFELEARLDRIRAMARAEADHIWGTLFDNPDFQLRFAEVAVDCEAVVAAARRTIDEMREGKAPGAIAELLNIRLREVGQRLTELMMEVLGPYAAADQIAACTKSSTAPVVGPEHARMPTAFYMAQRAATIAGGTPEIHRNNLARHYLHLTR